DDVVEADVACFLRQNRDVIRIPLHEGLALLDMAAVLDGDDGANDDGVRLEFAPIFSHNGNRSVLVQNDVIAVFERYDAEVVVAKRAVHFGFDLGLLELALGGSTDVECAHRKLRAGFTDGLRGDDANSFTELHQPAGGEVASVAIHTNAVLAF